MTSRLKVYAIAYVLLVVFAVYVAVAAATFRIRHPWMTDTEAQVWIGSTLRFEKVPYDVMRPREVK